MPFQDWERGLEFASSSRSYILSTTVENAVSFCFVGYYRLDGYGKIPKSKLAQKPEAGDRDIYDEYISFRCYKGKVVPNIERQRKKGIQTAVHILTNKL